MGHMPVLGVSVLPVVVPFLEIPLVADLVGVKPIECVLDFLPEPRTEASFGGLHDGFPSLTRKPASSVPVIRFGLKPCSLRAF